MRRRVQVLGAIMCVLSMSVATPVFAFHTIKATEARNHIGKTATVCGEVASTHYAASSHNRPIFINLDKPYPNQISTVVIWGSNRAKFGSPEIKYEGKDICATGKVREFRGTPEIIASDPAQIKIRHYQNK